MEIIQTIWTALTTENEWMVNFISIPLIFIEIYISMLLFTTILNIESTKKQKIIYLTVMFFFSVISRLIIPAPYNSYVNLVLMFFSIFFIFKISVLKTIVSLILPFIIIIFIESMFSKIYSFIFHLDYYLGMNIPLHRLIGTLSMYFIMFLIYLTFKYFKVNISKLEILNKRKKVLLILNIIFGIILIATQLYIITFYSNTLPLFVIILSTLSIIIYCGISLYTILTVSKLETTAINLEQSELHNKTLELLQDNMRAFRHDFANILQGMVGYIDHNDMVGLKKYYTELVGDFQETNNLTTLSPSVVNNPAIYNVLANKYHKADELGIKIKLEAFLNMNELQVKIYEFTRILGILLDNAIEASKECEHKLINVTFRKDSRRHMQLLVIENTYSNKDIDTEKIYEKGFSTKRGNTGLGLWEIRQILKKNNNLNLFTKKTDDLFIQQFEIFY